jgi:aminopeptidase N
MRTKASAFLAAVLAVGTCRAADILFYRVTLQPDFAQRAISGVTRIVVDPKREPTLRLPLHDLHVTSVDADGAPLPYRIEDGQLILTLSGAGPRELRIAYHGSPQEGLNFGPDYVNSAWQGCDWMLCDEDPGKKAPLALELLLPPGYVSLASGVPAGETRLTPGLVRHTWREERPYSSYLYGFAAGKFRHVEESAGMIVLHYYGVADDSALRRDFAPSAGMLAFLQEKAGVAMPHGAYRQLLIPGSEAQELSAFSVIGTDELDPMQADPKEDWAIVHEMAHQWWGNLLTCKSWPEFWLNEGITTFMVAAYKEQHWGHDAYAHEMALQQKRYQVAIDAGYDKPLSYGGSYPSLKIRRAIQYAKGALFMDTLRRELGDYVFWNGLRRYTQTHAGGSVTSHDLQAAMERAAGRKLDVPFGEWVY